MTTYQDPGDLRSGDGRGRETVAQREEPADQPTRQEDATLVATPKNIADAMATANDCPKSVCEDESILRNEATATPHDLCGCGRHPQGDASGPRSAGGLLDSQLDPGHPPLVTGQGVDLQPSPQNEISAVLAAPLGPTRERPLPSSPWRPPRRQRDRRTDPRARSCALRAASTT